MNGLKSALVALCLCLLALPMLAGCSAMQGMIDTKGVEAVQTSLQTAEDTICRYAPVGGVVRRYGADPESIRAWATLCLSTAVDGRGLADSLESVDRLPAPAVAPDSAGGD